MDILVLNEKFETVRVIDDYISLIWTERYAGPGDFSLEIHAKDLIKYNIRPNYFLWRKETPTLMCIEYIRLVTDVSAGNSILVKGRSLECYLDRRIALGKQEFDEVIVKKAIEDLMNENIIKPSKKERAAPMILDDFPSRSEKDKFSGIFQGETISDILEEICDVFDYGYYFRYNIETGEYHFGLYEGVDRSWAQEENTWVVYSPKLDTLINSEFVFDNSNGMTSFVICGEEESVTVNPTSGETLEWPQVWVVTEDDHTGWDRKEGFIDGSSVSRWQGDYMLYTGRPGVSIDTPRPSEYVTHGWKKLGEAMYTRILLLKTEQARKDAKEATLTFEAEGDHNVQWKIGEDMLLGDIVQMMNEFGIGARCRITEITLSHDRKGIKYYPTFKSLEDDIKEGGIEWPLPSASITRSTMIGCTTRPNL